MLLKIAQYEHSKLDTKKNMTKSLILLLNFYILRLNYKSD
ncbi:hypothetical protein RU91_GL000202 [Lactococcus lactis subsp. lactis]|nr:hypothetical protein RU91_GL000202 [Lactococcus lactis subsp. lactis]